MVVICTGTSSEILLKVQADLDSEYLEIQQHDVIPNYK